MLPRQNHHVGGGNVPLAGRCRRIGLYYLNARYYDSGTARFLTEDTYRGEKDDPLSLNLYGYCAGNPVKYADPSGHVAKQLLDPNFWTTVIDKGDQLFYEVGVGLLAVLLVVSGVGVVELFYYPDDSVKYDKAAISVNAPTYVPTMETIKVGTREECQGMPKGDGKGLTEGFPKIDNSIYDNIEVFPAYLHENILEIVFPDKLKKTLEDYGFDLQPWVSEGDKPLFIPFPVSNEFYSALIVTAAENNTEKTNPRHTEDQNALNNLGKEMEKQAKDGNPISYEEAQILDEWADEYGASQHHKAEKGSGAHFPGGNHMAHTHIYNHHIPYVYSMTK